MSGPCEMCDGTGYFLSGTTTCDACDGAGSYADPVEAALRASRDILLLDVEGWRTSVSAARALPMIETALVELDRLRGAAEPQHRRAA